MTTPNLAPAKPSAAQEGKDVVTSKCPRCRGTRRVQFQTKVILGGVVQNVITYEAECPRCEGAEHFLSIGRTVPFDPMRP